LAGKLIGFQNPAPVAAAPPPEKKKLFFFKKKTFSKIPFYLDFGFQISF
jgi:hypothetical protein